MPQNVDPVVRDTTLHKQVLHMVGPAFGELLIVALEPMLSVWPSTRIVVCGYSIKIPFFIVFSFQPSAAIMVGCNLWMPHGFCVEDSRWM